VRKPRPPKFKFVPTLALGASREDARHVFEDALGCHVIEQDDEHTAYGFGKQALYVDTSGSLAAAFGFLPLFAVDRLAHGIAHLQAHDCTVQPLPWDQDAPGRLVSGPGGITFCLVAESDVMAIRAERFLAASPQDPARFLADDDA